MADMPRMKIDVMNMPELIFRVRREMANMLRTAAGAESNPVVVKRLRELSNQFETGQTGRAVEDKG